MATDGERSHQPDDGDMLPDEREVIAERADDLDTIDADEYLSVEELAAELGIELDG